MCTTWSFTLQVQFYLPARQVLLGFARLTNSCHFFCAPCCVIMWENSLSLKMTWLFRTSIFKKTPCFDRIEMCTQAQNLWVSYLPPSEILPPKSKIDYLIGQNIITEVFPGVNILFYVAFFFVLDAQKLNILTVRLCVFLIQWQLIFWVRKEKMFT